MRDDLRKLGGRSPCPLAAPYLPPGGERGRQGAGQGAGRGQVSCPLMPPQRHDEGPRQARAFAISIEPSYSMISSMSSSSPQRCSLGLRNRSPANPRSPPRLAFRTLVPSCSAPDASRRA